MTDKEQLKGDQMMVIYLWQLFIILIVNILLLPCVHPSVCFYPSVASCHVLRL